MHKRVVVTGMGVVSPVGNNVPDFWKNLLTGKSGVDYITHFDASEYATKFAAEVKNFSTEGILEPKEARKMDRFTQFAMIAAEEAIKDSGLELDNINRDRTGVVVGSGIGGLQSLEDEH
ncbi:MAG: beta-ketoacyl synthase N-terminal-like domain-containing protein, partial [Calditrichia bacterium]